MRSRIVPLVVLALAATACGEGSMEPEEEVREILANPSFSANINEIIQRRDCASSGCHASDAGNMTLTADAAANYAAWVNVQADAEDFLRVEPGNPDDSYVVIKVEGRQTVGQRMPRGASPLDNIDLTNLRNWISNGAPNN